LKKATLDKKSQATSEKSVFANPSNKATIIDKMINRKKTF
jgi:hypothetical protein